MSGYEKVNYIDKCLKEYERDLLTMGLCNLFLPVSFVEERNITKGIYDCRGYEKLSEMKKTDTENCLQTIINLLNNISQTDKHCMFVENIDLRSENCYINPVSCDMKFLYLRDSNKGSLKEKTIRLMHSIFDKANENERDVLQKAIDMVSETEDNCKSIILCLEILMEDLQRQKSEKGA